MEEDILLLIVRYNQLTIRHIKAYKLPLTYAQEYAKLKESKAVGFDLKLKQIRTLVYKTFEGELFGFSADNQAVFHSNKVEVLQPFTDMLVGDVSKKIECLDSLTVTGLSKEIKYFLEAWTGWNNHQIALYDCNLSELTNKDGSTIKPIATIGRQAFADSLLECGTVGMLLYAHHMEAIGLLEINLEEAGEDNGKIMVLVVSLIGGEERTVTFNAIPFSLSDTTYDKLKKNLAKHSVRKRKTPFQLIFGRKKSING